MTELAVQLVNIRDTQASRLHVMQRVATGLLAAQSVEDIVDRVPSLLRSVCGDALGYHIDLDRASGDAHPLEVARLPLCIGDRCSGHLVVTADDTTAPGTCDNALIIQIVELLAVALAARQDAAEAQARAVAEASELKFDVVSMLSHEMRTPLASIKGYATALLLDDIDWDDSTRSEFLQSIDTEADHLTKLVADILESAAIEAGELRLDVEPILVPKIAGRVVDKIGLHTTAHTFVLMFPDHFPVVEADAQRVEQVLTNLVDNAVKYSPDGGLILLRGEARPREVIISVVDQGIGIAPEHLNKLFERFFRAQPGQRQRIVGTGLGLPIADAIVRAHGGRIWAESALGRGTTLSFTIPLTGMHNRGRADD